METEMAVTPTMRVSIDIRDAEEGAPLNPGPGSVFRYEESELMVVFMTQSEYDEWVRSREVSNDPIISGERVLGRVRAVTEGDRFDEEAFDRGAGLGN